MSAEGYEGLADGDAHGFTIRGLNVEDGDVLDSVRITVRDAQGAPVSGLDGVLLSDLAAAVGADGTVYVPVSYTHLSTIAVTAMTRSTSAPRGRRARLSASASTTGI